MLTVPSGHFFASGGGALALIATLADAEPVATGPPPFFPLNAKYAPIAPPRIATAATTATIGKPPFFWLSEGSVVFAVGTGSACVGASAVCAISLGRTGC